jgi:hypothetical protein
MWFFLKLKLTVLAYSIMRHEPNSSSISLAFLAKSEITSVDITFVPFEIAK